MVEEVRGHMGHGLAGVGHYHLGHIGGVGQVHLALGHERRGAAVDGVLGEGVAVHHIAHDAEEHVARLHGIAAKGQAAHFLVAVADDRAFHTAEQFCASLGHKWSVPLRNSDVVLLDSTGHYSVKHLGGLPLIGNLVGTYKTN